MEIAPLSRLARDLSPAHTLPLLFNPSPHFKFVLLVLVSRVLYTNGYQALATNAPTPDGYANVFTNLQGSLSASNYMGLYTLDGFDTLTCASKCDQASGCVAFNVYIERDPSRDPNAASCPNPSSTTNYKCTLWGAPVASGQATNMGQWRDSFQIVMAGSNGNLIPSSLHKPLYFNTQFSAYNKNSPPDGIPGYSGPVECGGAINAPLNAQGKDTYMGDKFYPFSQSQGYTPSTCAAACSAQTAYNQAHPAADGSYQTCVCSTIRDSALCLLTFE